VKSNEAASADEAKEEAKSNEVEKGVVERPDVGVWTPKLDDDGDDDDEAYMVPQMLPGWSPGKPLKLNSSSPKSREMFSVGSP
jgi:hypothetical protein